MHITSTPLYIYIYIFIEHAVESRFDKKGLIQNCWETRKNKRNLKGLRWWVFFIYMEEEYMDHNVGESMAGFVFFFYALWFLLLMKDQHL